MRQPGCINQEDQFFRIERHRRCGRDIFVIQIEGFTGGRKAHRREQHNVAVVERVVDRLRIHIAHLAGELEVDAVNHAQRLCGDKRTGNQTHTLALGHRRIWQPEGKQRLKLQPDRPYRTLDTIEHIRRGDAIATMRNGFDANLLKLCINLRARTVHHHHTNAQRDQQVDVLGERFDPPRNVH